MIFFFTLHNDGTFKSWRENITKDVRNLLDWQNEKKKKKGLDITIKDIRNFLDKEKTIKQLNTKYLEILETFLEQ